MAETALISLTSKILSTIASPAFEMAYERVKSIREARKELEELRQTIGSIQAVILDAEKRQEGSAVVKIWMERVRDVLYDADDLFDEVATADLLRQQMEGNTLSKKVQIFSSKLNSIVSNDSIAKKVKDIRKALQLISGDMGSFGLMSCMPHEKQISMRKEVVGSFVDPNKVIGREVEKETILKFLLDESKATESISMFAVVGIGGMGKTTLAQLIYNDGEVEQRFQSRWWVCISDIVDEKEILEKISQSMGVGNPQSYDVSMLQSKIRGSVCSAGKYLLVLDDVWDIPNSNPALWLNIMPLLEDGAEGSKVVVTTRFLSVPRLMLKDKSEVFELGGLPEDKSWELFKTIAFTQEQENDQEWTRLGREIWSKCAHVPLAIRSIAATLRSKTTKKEWEYIKNEKLLSDGTTMAALKLSYHHLPAHLKPCFAYCSLFPKHSSMGKDALVYIWMALGYVTPKDGETPEVVGHCYLLELLNRSFFQPKFEDEYGDIFSCKMHDLVHDLAENVSGEENSIVVAGSNNIQLKSGVRHLLIIRRMKDDALGTLLLPSADRLRSFFYFGSNLKPPNFDQLVTKYKLLRILCLSHKNIEIVPSCVGELLHLRHLDLSMNNFKDLPNSITKLVNLITLDLSDSRCLLMLPNDFCKLVSLRHLDTEGCNKLSHMPPNLWKLTQLQSLSCFKVGRAVDSGKSSSLAEMARLNITGKLRVDFDNRENAEECLQVPTSITDLEIFQFEGIRIPCLPTNLVRLCVESCPTIKYLPPIRCLPCLESLKLRYLDELEYVEDVDDGEHMNVTVTTSSTMPIFFPALRTLELSHLPKLKRWSRNVELKTAPSFPVLQFLRISVCPELMWMPASPQLQELTLDRVNAELMQQMLSPSSSTTTSLSCLHTLLIYRCHSSKTLSIEALSSLQRLKLWECPELKKLHNTSFHLNNLEELEIYKCPQLESWEQGNNGIVWDSLTSLSRLALTELPSPDTLPQCLQQRQARGELQISQQYRLSLHRSRNGAVRI